MKEFKFDKAKWEADVKTFMDSFCQAGAKYAMEKLTMEAQFSVLKFYATYHPAVYENTYNLRDNSYEPYFRGKEKNGVWYGGVRMGSKNMNPYFHGIYSEPTDPSVVAAITLGSGIHGGGRAPIMAFTNPTPVDYVKKVRDSEEFREEARSVAMSATKKQSYSYLEFK